MGLKVLCFVLVPLIFFGCGAYYYIHETDEKFDANKLPTKKAEIELDMEKAKFGRKR